MIPFYGAAIPFLTTEQMREVDRLMIEVYHIDLIQMMENAGRSLAQLARERFWQGQARGKRVVVLAGTGGNGGGALVAARWLHNAGASVEVVLAAQESRLTPVPAHQASILHRLGIPFQQSPPSSTAPAPDLVIDGLIGYSLRGAPGGASANLIRWANRVSAPVLALDVPSGVDSSTGEVHDPSIAADATMTLALPKTGLRTAKAQVGALYLANISVPVQLYAGATLNVRVDPIFEEGDIVQLW